MKWVVAAIAGFVVVYTWVTIVYRKDAPPHEPYDAARYRSGYDLREAGWQPFLNAYALAPESPEVRGAPYPLAPLPVERIATDAGPVAEWSRMIPDVQQGERAAEIEGPSSISRGQPFIARVHWDPPADFQEPQLVFFRRGREILLFSRVPPRRRDPVPQTAFVIPPEFLEQGEYHVWLATTGELTHWTFEVK